MFHNEEHLGLLIISFDLVTLKCDSGGGGGWGGKLDTIHSQEVKGLVEKKNRVKRGTNCGTFNTDCLVQSDH